MTKYNVLVSSDHHANWEALEELFKIAKDNNVPFVINGDVIGDYNFEEIAKMLKLKFPYEITSKKLSEKLNKKELEFLSSYQQIQQAGGNIDALLSRVPLNEKEDAKKKIQEIVEFVQSKEFQNKLNTINQEIEVETAPIVSNYNVKLRSLYRIVVSEHAKIFANLIDKYGVKVYFILGNHEPVHFSEMVKSFLKNLDLYVDLNSEKGIIDINGLKCVGVSNVKALMPFLHQIFNEKELNKIFSHQMGVKRPILFRNVSDNSVDIDNVGDVEDLHSDLDWIRISDDKHLIKELDVLFTHGQVGRGAWSDERQANEMPTLYIAALLCKYAKITVDGHLHTTYEMENPFGKPIIRAVGNKGFLISKDSDGEIKYELVEVDKEYNHRNGVKLDFNNLDDDIIKEIFNPSF